VLELLASEGEERAAADSGGTENSGSPER